MMDYMVNDLLEITPMASPYGLAWCGCLFIGSREACEQFVAEVTGGTDNGSNYKEGMDSAPGRSGDG